MIKARKIELLAPAKNLECGLEAINHGADAVYIGAPRFSARAAAGNTLEDIEQLVRHAHQFNVNVYVALNTILKDEELQDTEKLIWKLYRIGVDALIIQDMGITMLNLPPLPLHASTQMDNRTVEKVRFLEDAGFSQVVLARELPLEKIRNIAGQVDIPLEVFVHGALCVSYSGQCYLSQAICNRSANRGTCAQLCRLPYSLTDSEGNIIMENKHFLSLKDLNLSGYLEELLDAGVSSLKIEGRLKDISYVKNVVSYYRQTLDNIFSRRPEYYPASSGKTDYYFVPDLQKTFNRGYTDYFLHERQENIWSFHSPKSTGEGIGKVKDVFDRFFVLAGTKKLNNGDGLCFFNDRSELQGMRVNRVDGKKVFFAETGLKLRRGITLYRNYDHEFEKLLSRKTADRKIEVSLTLRDTLQGFAIDAEDEDGNRVTLAYQLTKENAHKDQRENIRNNLSKTGNTIFKAVNIQIQFSENWFIPASTVSEWRRNLFSELLRARLLNHRNKGKIWRQSFHPFPGKNLSYLGNVMNEKSREFYIQHGTTISEMAFEQQPKSGVPLMFTKHCIKYSMGWCPKTGNRKGLYKEPYFLKYNDTFLRLDFDCKACEMKVVEEDK